MKRKRLIKVPSTKRVREFVKRLEVVTELLADMVVSKDVPNWLCTRNKGFHGKSPLQVIWEEGEKGFEKVMDSLEAFATGSFS